MPTPTRAPSLPRRLAAAVRRVFQAVRADRRDPMRAAYRAGWQAGFSQNGGDATCPSDERGAEAWRLGYRRGQQISAF